MASKKLREIVFQKYGGRCAYCGCELEKGWHVDHIQAKRRGESEEWIQHINKSRLKPLIKGEDTIENYNPSCAPCNIWKGTYSIEQFRSEIKLQMNRLNAYNSNYRNAKRYGLITETEIEVKFYFEKIS